MVERLAVRAVLQTLASAVPRSKSLVRSPLVGNHDLICDGGLDLGGRCAGGFDCECVVNALAAETLSRHGRV